jgi:hypothetical protein
MTSIKKPEQPLKLIGSPFLAETRTLYALMGLNGLNHKLDSEIDIFTPEGQE